MSRPSQHVEVRSACRANLHIRLTCLISSTPLHRPAISLRRSHHHHHRLRPAIPPRSTLFALSRNSAPRGDPRATTNTSTRGPPALPDPGTCPPIPPHPRVQPTAQVPDLHVERRDEEMLLPLSSASRLLHGHVAGEQLVDERPIAFISSSLLWLLPSGSTGIQTMPCWEPRRFTRCAARC